MLSSVPRHISFDAVRPGTVFAERYFVVRPIKAGGMGAVFEVQHVRTHKAHALKVMHPDVVAKKGAREKFEQEAYIGARIKSRNVVDVVDAGVDDGTGLPYLVMELLVGSELAAIVEREGRIEPRRLVGWLAQVARALDRAHARGIIHRDLKPENIFVTKNEDGSPFVKVLDFGIAKIVEGATREGTDETGTPLYMAPEQTARGQLIGPATDVWALAIVAFECLVGQTYWRANSVAEFYRELLFDELPSPTARAATFGVTLPAGFDAWFFGCVEREPSKRFATAGEAIAALAAAYGFDASAARSGSFPGVESPPSRDRVSSGQLSPSPRPSPSGAATPSFERPLDPSLDDAELPRFGNRRRTLGIVVSVLLLGGVGAAVLAARGNGFTPPAEPSSAQAAQPPPVATHAAPAPTPSGPPATVQEAIKLAGARRDVCLEAARKRKPGAKGKVVIDFQIDAEGSVREEKIVESTIDDPEAEVCLLGVVRSLKVAPPEKPAGKKPKKQIYTYTAEAG